MDKKEKKERRERLKAIIEGNRISRLPQKTQNDTLKKLQKEKQTAKGFKKNHLDVLVDVISEKQEQADEAIMNQTYAEYNVF